MKILRITPIPPEVVGGLPYYYKNLSLYLSTKKNVKTDILTPNIFNKNIKIFKLDKNVRIIYKKCYFNLANKNPFSYIIPFLKKNYHKYDILHAHGYYFFTTLQCALFKDIRKFPFILHVHGGIQSPVYPKSKILDNFQVFIKNTIFDKTIGKIPFKKADRIISVAYNDLKIIQQKYNLHPKISYHIPNGVDLVKFRKKSKIQRKYITLVATRLSYIKGVDIFLKIALKLYRLNNELEFLIIGQGELENNVVNMQNHIPLKFLPYFPYKNIEDIYNMSKLLIITSRTEGVPNIIYESMACETPIVSSNVGGIPNVIKNGFNGYIFNISDIDEAVRIILRIINDNQELERLGINGRELIKRKYSWNHVIEQIYHIYKEIM